MCGSCGGSLRGRGFVGRGSGGLRLDGTLCGFFCFVGFGFGFYGFFRLRFGSLGD